MTEDWPLTKLGDLFDITSSKRVFESQWKKEGVPFYRAREIVKLARDGFVDNELFISKEMFEEYRAKYGVPTEGDIMVTGVGTLGICHVVRKGDKFYFKDGNIIWLKKKAEVNSRFVEYGFKSEFLRKQIDDHVGATVGTYTIIKAKNTVIPIPSIEGQRRIVAILDEAFEAVATATANAEKNLANAAEIFESRLNSIFERSSENWIQGKLKDLTSKIGSGATPLGGEESYKEAGTPLIRSLNVHDRQFLERRLAFIDEEQASKLAHVEVREGDVLLNITGASIARCCIAPNEFLPARVNQHVAIIRPKEERLSSAFLCYLLTSKPYKERLLGVGDGAGATRQALTKAGLQDFSISLPSTLSEQKKITWDLDKLSKTVAQLEDVYQRKKDCLSKLRQSILQQAFEGKLAPVPSNALDPAAE